MPPIDSTDSERRRARGVVSAALAVLCGVALAGRLRAQNAAAEHAEPRTDTTLEEPGHDVLADFIANLPGTLSDADSDEVEAVFDFVEQSRGRALLELIERPDARPDADQGADDASSAGAGVNEQQFAALRRAAGEERVGLGEVRAGLASTEFIFSYFWTERLCGLIVVPPAGSEQVEVFELARGETATNELGARLVRAAEALALEPRARQASTLAALEHELQALWTALLPARAVQKCDEARRVVVLSDGPLHDLPLAALAPAGGLGWGEDGSHLRPAFVYAPAASVYLDRKHLAQSRRTRRSDEPVAFILSKPDRAQHADPRSDTRPVPGPETHAEAEALAALFDEGRAVVFSGEADTRAGLEGRASGARFLHLATHAMQGTNEPQAALTPDRLTRVWSGRLGDAELVVLPACDTIDAPAFRTNLTSLSWGFFLAGSPSVVGSHWKVDDEATALLMTRFYENLLGRYDEPRHSGPHTFEAAIRMPKSCALREAQTWLRTIGPAEARERLGALGLEQDGAPRSNTGESALVEASSSSSPGQAPYADPFFWASFTLLGDPN